MPTQRETDLDSQWITLPFLYVFDYDENYECLQVIVEVLNYFFTNSTTSYLSCMLNLM